MKSTTISDLTERSDIADKTIGVHVNWRSRNAETNRAQEDKEEFEVLVSSAGINLMDVITTSRSAPDSKFFIGKGKTQELKEIVQSECASLVIFNHDLSPIQERNLEQELQCRVVDRTGLILDIFAQRAQSHEGQLQVELAQLQHLSTRLVRGWTHLERQRGGIGMRGPGEKQLETDRRLVQTRIKTIKKQLSQVKKQRAQNRRARQQAEIPTVSVVGYTNAGKSTLFNYMTKSEVYAADRLFATLDPTVRKIDLPLVGTTLVSDTVGFIRHLPHQLVESFQSTLEETLQAQLIMHVVDISNPEYREQIEEVNIVLEQIGAEKTPVLMVCNKIDSVENREPKIDYDHDGMPWRVWLSAKTGDGIELLEEALQARLIQPIVHFCMKLKSSEGKLRSKLYELDAIIVENMTESGDYCLDIKLQQRDFNKLLKYQSEESYFNY